VTSPNQWLEPTFSPALSNLRYIGVLTTASPSWVSWFEFEVYGTSTINAPALYDGFLDVADCMTLSGWAADRNRLNTAVNVDLYDSAAYLTSVTANQSRPDVGA